MGSKNRRMLGKVNIDSWVLVGLSIYLVFVVFSPDFVIGALSSHAIEFRLTDLFLLVLLGYLIYLVGTGKKHLTYPTIFFPALAYIGTFFLGALVSAFKVGPGLGLESTLFAIKYLEYFLIFFVTVNLVRNLKQIDLLLRLLLWLSAVSGLLLVFMRFISQLHLTLTIKLPSFTPQFHHLYNPRFTLPFAKGFGPSAEFLVIMIPLALFFFAYSSQFYDRIIYLSFTGLLGVALILTGSRGPMVGLFLAVLFLVPFLEKKLIPWIFAGVLGIGGLSLTVPFFRERVRAFWVIFSKGVCANNSMCVRVTEIWPEGIDQFTKNPIVGKGLASFPTSDTQYIRLLADQGIIGLTAFVAFITVLLLYLFKLKRRSKSGSTGNILSKAMIISVVALLINGITATAFEPVRAMEPFWFLLGLVFSFENFEDCEGTGFL